MSLESIWFFLIGVLFAGYAVLDGFDLGLGALSPVLARSDGDRTTLRHAIGPYWDGNEVWLLTAGGALFAAFPMVYATVFSGFYLALMLVLFSLIFRAVSIEFAAKDPAWTPLWNWGFFLGSALPSLIYGVAVGNLVRGVPLTQDGDFAGTFFGLLHPYALLVGLLGLSMILQHGSSWAALKTEGELRLRAVRARSITGWAFLALLAAATPATAWAAPDHFEAVLRRPAGWLALTLVVGGFLASMLFKDDLRIFLGSAVRVVGAVGLWAAGLYPNLVPALGEPADSLTVGDSSSDLTLTVMLIIAGIGVPVVLAYTALLYRVFRGKVQASAGMY